MSREVPVRFCESSGVKLPRSTHLVILARHMSRQLVTWIENQLESSLGLQINREKTRIARVAHDGGSLDFLGFTLRYDRDLKGRGWKYLNAIPSSKSVARLRENLRTITKSCSKRSFKDTVARMSAVLRGWGNYFSWGYPRMTFKNVNYYVLQRMRQFLKNRSQRKSKPLKQEESLYRGLRRYGLYTL